MNELIAWVIEVEDTASRVYEKASCHFSNDIEFSEFLMGLSRDENMHKDVIFKAIEKSADINLDTMSITIDEDTRKLVEGYFSLIEQKIAAGTISKTNMLDCIVSTEFYEYNDIFLYGLKSLGHISNEFISSRIHQHKKDIEQYLESHPELISYLSVIKSLPDTWHEKILIVENDTITSALLEAVLRVEGIIECVVNGEEGLNKLSGKYYDVIIAEVNLPVLNGIEFYNKAVARYPNIKERFLFFTGSKDDSILNFLKENNIRHILKPASIINIKKAVIDIQKNRK